MAFSVFQVVHVIYLKISRESRMQIAGREESTVAVKLVAISLNSSYAVTV